MTTVRTSAARTYARSEQTAAITCGARSCTQFYIGDRSTWETFERTDLPAYIADGITKIAPHIQKVANMAQPYTEQDEQQLRFMVEALLHARHAADELTVTR